MRMTSELRLLAVAAYMAGFPILLIWLSGDWRWAEGWIFGLWFAACAGGSMLRLYFKDPALLAERMRRPGSGGQSRADLAILIGVKLGTAAWFMLPPLGIRFGWTPRLPLWSEACGGVFLLAGGIFFFRAFTDNPFLSQLVRIQADRGQHVVDTGVYGCVRHPMYLGASLLYVGAAMLLRSAYGALAAVSVVLLLVVRIRGEERLLARELAGYQAYRQRVRYRLLPPVW
ncbi:MAG TPA: isoprenylcysteine carboxylmethyltransferase family protein [Bryobacteraceae bacterium]|nr:isoprenylcysteine carboxylmethyltransferase family protein [Bryobacteraceae bacterium]